MYTTSTIIFIYIFYMCLNCFRAKQLAYLWTSILLWLGTAIIGTRLLPGVYGPYSLISFYLAPVFFLLASGFYLYHSCQFNASWKEISCESDKNITLGALTLSNIVVHGGFLMTLAAIWFLYPAHLQRVFLPGLLFYYYLQPIWLIGLIATCTVLIILFTKLNHRKTIKLTMTQLLFFSCMIALTSVIRIIYPLFSKMA